MTRGPRAAARRRAGRDRRGIRRPLLGDRPLGDVTGSFPTRAGSRVLGLCGEPAGQQALAHGERPGAGLTGARGPGRPRRLGSDGPQSLELLEDLVEALALDELHGVVVDAV